MSDLRPRTATRRLRHAFRRSIFPRVVRMHVTCPCCGRSFRRFEPFHGRPNALCPGCGSLERHRVLYLLLRDELRLFDRSVRLLHLAPERALQAHLAAADLEYVSADLDSPLAEVSADVTDLPFEDASFDVVLCSHVLEHVPDDRRALAELYRVLALGGLAVIAVPITAERTFEDATIVEPSDRLRAFGQEDHVRRCGPDYRDRVTAAGFVVDEIDYARDLGDAKQGLYALLHEPIYLCAKA